MNRVKLLNASAVTGAATMWEGGNAALFLFGTWDSATATLQASPDGTNFIAVPNASATADGMVLVAIPPGQVRVAISSAGGSTSLSAVLVEYVGEVVQNIDPAELDGVTAGTVSASKSVVVDSNKDAGTFRNLTATDVISTEFTATTVDEDDTVHIDLGVIGKVRRFHETITLATDGATTDTGFTPDGLILAAAIRVSTQIAGLDSADHHIQLGVAGTVDKYCDAAQGSSATSIAVNKKAHYAGAAVHEAAELILTITEGADQTPSAGAVEVEVLYLARADIADVA